MTACSANLGNRSLTEGLLITGAFAMGMVESISTTSSTFPLRSQEEIGEGGETNFTFSTSVFRHIH